jgi:hypothetical protein
LRPCDVVALGVVMVAGAGVDAIVLVELALVELVGGIDGFERVDGTYRLVGR